MRKSVEVFANAMEKKLKANDHKRHWGNCEIDYLEKRLEEEYKECTEVLTAIYTLQNLKWSDDELSHILIEAAKVELVDMANFCMMIYDNLG